MEYEVLYFNGWASPPAYYLICMVEGDSPQQALLKDLPRIKEELADVIGLDEEWSDKGKFKETLYVLRENGLLSVSDAKRLIAAKRKLHRKRNGR